MPRANPLSTYSRFRSASTSPKTMPKKPPGSRDSRFSSIRSRGSQITERSTSKSPRKPPIGTKETAGKKDAWDDEDSDAPIQPRSRKRRQDVEDMPSSDDEVDFVTEPSAGSTPSPEESNNDYESANDDSEIDDGDNDFNPHEEEEISQDPDLVPLYARADPGSPSARRRRRRRFRTDIVLKEHHRGLQERQSHESLPIFGLTEAQASHGQLDRLPPFVFPNQGTRDQVFRTIVLTNELGYVEYDSPRTEMTTRAWDAGDAYRFWVAHLGGGEWRHIMGIFGKGEEEERFYAWMGVGRGFEGPVRAFPALSGGRIGWAGVNLDAVQEPRQSFSVDTSQASFSKSLVVKLKVDLSKFQNLVTTGEVEVIDLVSDDEAPIKKERSPPVPYPTPLPSTPSVTTTGTGTLSPYQLERTILTISIPPAKRELTFYLSDIPSLEAKSFFTFIADLWSIDTQAITQLLVYLPWVGRQKVIKPQLDSTWFLLLKAIQAAPCWGDGDECELDVEISVREGVSGPVKGETDGGVRD